MVKVVHCPTFAKKLFGVIDNIGNIAPSTNALLFGIYYTALSSCTARETRQRFGESQEELMQRYGRYFESAIGHSFDCPSLEALQALVLYMVCFNDMHLANDTCGANSNPLRFPSPRSRTSDMEAASSISFSWQYARHRPYDFKRSPSQDFLLSKRSCGGVFGIIFVDWSRDLLRRVLRGNPASCITIQCECLRI